MTRPRTSGSRRSPRAPSMADVAHHAGVSGQTVSRVSNGLRNVDAATRERVLESMRVLGYRPNGAARALKSGRFNSIGVITFTLDTLGNMKTLDAIANEASEAECSVTLIRLPEHTLGAVSGAYRRLEDQAVDGVVIVFEARLLDRGDIDLPPGLPVVFIDSKASSSHAVVDTDQGLGARQATEHLISLGHSTVHHLGGPESSFSAAHREDAWREALQAHGRRVPRVAHGDWTAASGYRHALALAGDPEVTAIFAANDQMALGAIRALHELGRDVPGDVSIVGFDDMEDASFFWPPLTTISQDFASVGRIAVRSLLDRIGGATGPFVSTLVPTRLVVRASTAPPRDAHAPSAAAGPATRV